MSIQSMIMSNNVADVQNFLQKLNKTDLKKIINKIDLETGDTPLISALRVGNWNIVSLLMKYGADPMGKNRNQEIPARIKSPIRSLFISEYLGRSSHNSRSESLLVVASDVILSSLNNSYNTISDTIDSCQFTPRCLKCQLAKATYYHKNCEHIVLCSDCTQNIFSEENNNEEEKCPSCKQILIKEDMLEAEYVILDDINNDNSNN